jgi:hypothetical protein
LKIEKMLLSEENLIKILCDLFPNLNKSQKEDYIKIAKELGYLEVI